VIVAIIPNFMDPNTIKYPIDTIEVKLSKFDTAIKHRDILGSLLGTGIDRSKIGDIFCYDDKGAIFVIKDITNHIISNLTHIGRRVVTCTVAPAEEMFIPLTNYLDINIKISGLRLSGVVSKGFKISRTTAADLISKKKISINWEIISKDTKNIKIGDTLTVRGYGRIIINTMEEKNENITLNIHVYK